MRRPKTAESTLPDDLSGLLVESEWDVHRGALRALEARGVRFAAGGGFAFSAWSGRWRNTKDVDLFLRPADREIAVEALLESGFSDYHEQLPYDRNWIFRGYRGGYILDLIWQMANYRAEVDDVWVSGPEVRVWGDRVRILPVEELIWSKLYVMQRDRCDWPDLLNLLHVRGPTLDWDHLIARVGADLPLVAGLVSVFAWLSPAEARELPRSLWGRLGLAEPTFGTDRSADRRRIDLLDSRDWFGPKKELG